MNNLLETLTTEQLNQVKTVTLKKDEILFHEGDVCEVVGIVIDGEVDIVSYSYGGNEIIFNHLLPKMMFGNNLLFSSDPRYKGSVIAKKPAKIGLINKKSLISILKDNETFLASYLQYQADMSKELNGKIKLLSLDNAEERFTYFLHSHGDKIAFKSITNVASSLSLQRETLSRLISRMIKEEKISKNKNQIVLLKK